MALRVADRRSIGELQNCDDFGVNWSFALQEFSIFKPYRSKFINIRRKFASSEEKSGVRIFRRSSSSHETNFGKSDAWDRIAFVRISDLILRCMSPRNKNDPESSHNPVYRCRLCLSATLGTVGCACNADRGIPNEQLGLAGQEIVARALMKSEANEN